jgi:DNA-3-methyladenine glycosylase I
MSHTKICPDGIERCSWVTDDQVYLDYHDKEWGVPLSGQRELFEAISLEGFQAGLSWLTILKRREHFRAAFANFEPHAVAGFDEWKIADLMQDPGIIRNRAKITAAIHNARLVIEKEINLSQLLWSFAPDQLPQNKDYGWQATSPESDRMSRELKRLGFKFVGSTTMYALMQSTGMIQDHAPNCQFGN